MSAYTKNENRRKSMVGTALFAIGIVAVVASVITRSTVVVIAAAVLLVPAAVMLYEVGRSLRK